MGKPSLGAMNTQSLLEIPVNLPKKASNRLLSVYNHQVALQMETI